MTQRVGRHVFAVIMVCAILAIVGGCERGVREPEPSEIPGIYEAPKGLRFSLTVRPQTLTLGQRVYMEASLFNDSDRLFKQSAPNGCHWSYEVLAEDGHRVGPVHTCVDSASSDLRLEPGELRMIVREWAGRDYFDGLETVAPGRYEIVVGLMSRDVRVIPMAQPVWIEIKPRAR